MARRRLSVRTALRLGSLLTVFLPGSVRRRWRRPALETLRETLVGEPSLRTAVLELASLASWVATSWRAAARNAVRSSSRPKSRELFFDAASALRSLRRRPGYSVAALGLLSLGLGSATAIFSVLDPVLLRAPSYDPDRELFSVRRQQPGTRFSFSSHSLEARDLFAEASSIAALGMYTYDTATLFDGGIPTRIDIGQIDEKLLGTLRVAPLLGRGFDRSDLGKDVVLLSESLWHQRFEGSSDALGRTIEVDDREHQIIGVLPRGFTFLEPTIQLWVPLRPTERGGDAYNAGLVARLEGQVLPAPAAEELNGLAIGSSEATDEPLETLSLVPFAEERLGQLDRSSLALLMSAVALLLISACANAGNLAFTQATSRSGELAVRAALGASRRRLAALLLGESLLLCLGAAVLGLALAHVGVSVLLRLAPETIRSSASEASVLHPRVFVFSLVVALLSVLFTGALPCLRALAARRPVESTRSTRRLGTAFAAIQVGLGFLLLCAAGLIFKSFDRLISVDPGFDSDNVLTVGLDLSGVERYGSVATVKSTYEELEGLIETLPGVSTVSLTAIAPPRMSVLVGIAPQAEGREPISEEEDLFLPVVHVGLGYFDLMRIPLLRGRDFQRSDRSDRVILGRSLAQRLFGNVDAVGHRIRMSPEDPWLEVVGVASEVRQTGPADTLSPLEIYMPLLPDDLGEERFRHLFTLLIKTESAPLAHLPAIRDAIWQVDERLPLSRVRTLEAEWQRSMSRTRFLLEILGLLSSMTLILAFGGLYGVLSYAVLVRRREIGLRVALGAQKKSVQWLVVRQAVTAGLAGILASFGLAVAAGQLLEQQLFETSPLEPSVLLAAGGGILLLVAAAAWVPTSRATAVDPGDALRSD